MNKMNLKELLNNNRTLITTLIMSLVSFALMVLFAVLQYHHLYPKGIVTEVIHYANGSVGTSYTDMYYLYPVLAGIVGMFFSVSTIVFWVAIIYRAVTPKENLKNI